ETRTLGGVRGAPRQLALAGPSTRLWCRFYFSFFMVNTNLKQCCTKKYRLTETLSKIQFICFSDILDSSFSVGSPNFLVKCSDILEYSVWTSMSPIAQKLISLNLLLNILVKVFQRVVER